jgi:A/G-specific adenine glycosylase
MAVAALVVGRVRNADSSCESMCSNGGNAVFRTIEKLLDIQENAYLSRVTRVYPNMLRLEIKTTVRLSIYFRTENSIRSVICEMVFVMSEASLAKFGHRRISLEKITFAQSALLQWGKSNLRIFPWRRDRATIYHLVVSEVLLQRTRAETVSAFWPAFTRRFPSWRAIASAEVEEIETLLQPIGLSKQRAPRLHSLARTVVSFRGRFPLEREEIEALPGVGQYIANAIATFCHGTPQPLLDVNMVRVIERFFGNRKLADIRDDPFLQRMASALVQHEQGALLNWVLLDHASLVCKIRDPRCVSCPLIPQCPTGQKLLNRKSNPKAKVKVESASQPRSASVRRAGTAGKRNYTTRLS